MWTEFAVTLKGLFYRDSPPLRGIRHGQQAGWGGKEKRQPFKTGQRTLRAIDTMLYEGMYICTV